MSGGEYLIELMATADGRPIRVPTFVRSYDPNGIAGQELIGLLTVTRDPSEALRFPDQVAAWMCWKQTSTVMPTRPDGRPNRPLTAWTIRVRKA